MQSEVYVPGEKDAGRWSCLWDRALMACSWVLSSSFKMSKSHLEDEEQSLRVIAAEAFVLSSDSPLMNFKEASLPPTACTEQSCRKQGTASVVSVGHRACSAGGGQRTRSWQWTQGTVTLLGTRPRAQLDRGVLLAEASQSVQCSVLKTNGNGLALPTTTLWYHWHELSEVLDKKMHVIMISRQLVSNRAQRSASRS